MKKRTTRAPRWLSVILAVVAVVAVALWWFARPPVTVEAVDDLIRTKLPLGSDKEAVIRLASAHRWSCSGYMGPDAPERKVTLFCDYHAPGLIYVQTDAWNEWIIYYCYIDIFFLFDKREKLTGYSVVKAVEGP